MRFSFGMRNKEYIRKADAQSNATNGELWDSYSLGSIEQKLCHSFLFPLPLFVLAVHLVFFFWLNKWHWRSSFPLPDLDVSLVCSPWRRICVVRTLITFTSLFRLAWIGKRLVIGGVKPGLRISTGQRPNVGKICEWQIFLHPPACWAAGWIWTFASPFI